MPEQSEALRLFPPELVWPAYENLSIANIPATVATLLGVPFDGLPPLQPQTWQPLAGDVERVILLLMDAWGWNLLEAERPFLQPFLDRATVVTQLTSIFPSTTVAALSSLWTGSAPAQHGLVGLRLFLPEYAALSWMLDFSPEFAKFQFPDALVDAGLDATRFLHAPGFAEQLAAAGVPTYVFKGRDIVDSALSRMHGRGVTESHGVLSFADMLVQIRQLLEARRKTPLFVSAYWPSVDSLSHRYGWNAPHTRAELHALVAQLQQELIEALPAAARRGTLLLVAADHGQLNAPVEREIYLEDHPELAQMLFMRPAGEPRAPYLYVKHGQQHTAVDYINTHLGHAMVAWPAADALAAGLLGPPPHAPQADARVGDVVVAMRADYLLLTKRPEAKQTAHKMVGRHGGLTRAEMLVPWLGFRLDD